MTLSVGRQGKAWAAPGPLAEPLLPSCSQEWAFSTHGCLPGQSWSSPPAAWAAATCPMPIWLVLAGRSGGLRGTRVTETPLPKSEEEGWEVGWGNRLLCWHGATEGSGFLGLRSSLCFLLAFDGFVISWWRKGGGKRDLEAAAHTTSASAGTSSRPSECFVLWGKKKQWLMWLVVPVFGEKIVHPPFRSPTFKDFPRLSWEAPPFSPPDRWVCALAQDSAALIGLTWEVLRQVNQENY